jgi:hypothetical protein
MKERAGHRWWPVMVLACSCGSSARLSADAAGGPAVVVPAHFAEGRTGKRSLARESPATPAADGGGVPEVQKRNGTPDPPPLTSATQWLYRFEYKRGTIVVASVVKKEFDRPIPTERRVGRFAVELWVGRELVDRVRFDFPLLAADPAAGGRKQPLRESTAFGPGAETSREVLVPASDRATRAVLIDRLNGRETPLPWPPDAKASAKADAPAP